MFHVSGLWQYRQRNWHPAIQATNRTPGPSTVEPVVNECRNPMSPVSSAVFTTDLGNFAAQVHAKFERTFRLERNLFRRLSLSLIHVLTPPWNVRLITSICCSRVSRTKFTAYPETRIVSCGYFSGWSIASSSISRFNTFTFMW